VVPGVGHHVTQRGNRRPPTFFQKDDYAAYRTLRGEWCGRCGVAVWAYCLMNPVRAKLCRVPWRWRWSSAAAHLAGQDDAVVRVAPLLERVQDGRAFLLEPRVRKRCQEGMA
jgi:hypothetical protein